MKHNDEVLFRRITTDDETKVLIHQWMNNIELSETIRYRCFARILEATGMIGPFNLSYKGKPRSDTFICEYSKKGKKTSVTVFLQFCDGCDLPGGIWIDDPKCETRKIFNFLGGKIVPHDESIKAWYATPQGTI